MNADEIRKLFDVPAIAKDGSAPSLLELQIAKVSVLGEIAAQLAEQVQQLKELNENIVRYGEFFLERLRR